MNFMHSATILLIAERWYNVFAMKQVFHLVSNEKPGKRSYAR